MHFEEEDVRTGDEDPEFTGAAVTEEVDDEFLADDVPLVDDDADLTEEDDEDNELAADL